MERVSRIEELRRIIKEEKMKGRRIGFVPTMGFLHRGHLSLVEESRKHSGYQVMSIFVNKIQFNDKSDFNSYPRDLENDSRLAEDAGVDLLFTPEDSEVYEDNLTSVHMEKLTDNLCGAYRPGHFDGVFTVVSKLFNMVQPDVSVFGQKDIQQAVSIEKMVMDLNFPVEIIIAPIIREDSGLAMSSRNKHLSTGERERALTIYRGLCKAEERLKSGIRETEVIIKEIEKVLVEGNPDRVDYISVVDYHSLDFINRVEKKSVIAVAAFFGSTRLIDNMIVEVKGNEIECIY
jgi:pantoate--beta-alanine ligase